MDLSIIIPLYNAEKYIKRCIQSIYAQNLNSNNFEVLVINDESSDEGPEIVNRLIKQHPNLFLFHQKNQGPGVARNKGREKSKGNYIYYLDADDYLSPNGFTGLVDKMKERKLQVLGFSSTIARPEKDLVSITDNDKKQLEPVMSGYEFLAKYRYRNEVWWYIIEKDYLNQIDLSFDNSRMMEDIRFTMELFLKAQRVAFLPIKIHHYFEHPDSILHTTEKVHFNNLIKDFRRTVKEFKPIIARLNTNSTQHINVLHKLKARQESFVFFTIIRFLKSDLAYSELNNILSEAKSCNAYPFKYFPNHEYPGRVYKILTFMFNNPILLKIIFTLYRGFKGLKNQI